MGGQVRTPKLSLEGGGQLRTPKLSLADAGGRAPPSSDIVTTFALFLLVRLPLACSLPCLPSPQAPDQRRWSPDLQEAPCPEYGQWLQNFYSGGYVPRDPGEGGAGQGEGHVLQAVWSWSQRARWTPSLT